MSNVMNVKRTNNMYKIFNYNNYRSKQSKGKLLIKHYEMPFQLSGYKFFGRSLKAR